MSVTRPEDRWGAHALQVFGAEADMMRLPERLISEELIY
jgi:hypothetical protein